MRRRLSAVAAGAAALAAVGAVAPLASRADTVPIVVLDGRGFGHGVGMAQDGAYWMGAAGESTEQILGQFYPGTALGTAQGAVRVPVQDAGPAPSSAVVSFPNGGEVRDAPSGEQSPGFPVKVAPGGAVRITWDGGRYAVAAPGGPVALGRVQMAASYRPVSPAQIAPPPLLPPWPTTTTTTTTAPPSTSTTTAPPADPPPATDPPATSPTDVPPASPTDPPPEQAPPPSSPAAGPTSSRPLWAVPDGGGTIGVPARGHTYRGVVQATAAGGTLRLVDQVDVESYLKGMGEVRDPRWPAAALRAQAIAARTYALRAMAASGEICDTQRCQVYLGAGAEYAAMNAAVDATRGRVLVYRNALASAVYSANGGGFSASREEGFGQVSGDMPYLRAAPYPTQDPAPWQVRVALTDVAARLGYRGRLSDVRVEQAGPSGRALTVTLDGDAGARRVAGLDVAAAFGLRSTLFSIRVEQGAAPPPPPPDPAALVQVPPDAAAAAPAEPEPPAVLAPPRASRSRAAGRDGQGSPRHPTEDLPDGLVVVAGWLVVAAACATGIASRRPGA